MIPKIIHQTWKDFDPPADIYFPEWLESWKKDYPDWEHLLWSDQANESLIMDEYPEFYGVYQSLNKGVERSDLARILYMHKFGGVYVDLDFVSLRPLDPVLNALPAHIIVGEMAKQEQPVPNAFLASPKGDEFWLRVAIDGMVDFRENDVDKTESIFGADRLNWALEAYRPNVTRLASDCIYPFKWGNQLDQLKLQGADKTDLDYLRSLYPNSFAVTFWSHNW